MALTSTLPGSRAILRLDARRILRTYSFGFALLLAGLLLIANLIAEQGSFGLTDQLANVAPMAIAALASAPSILGGGFDLSISPLLVFTNSVLVVWLAPHGLGGPISVPIVLTMGLLVGAMNGLVIVWLRIQPIVVTLATYFILQGVDLMMAPQPVSISTSWVQRLAQSIGPMPGAFFTIGPPLLIWLGLRFVPFRRYLYAVGSSDAAAFSSGVNVAAVRVGSYALGGLFAGFGGIALTALVSTADASQSTEYTFVAVAAVALGGISLAGGRGALPGALFGAFSIYLLQNLLATLQVDPAYLPIIYGGMLVVAVVLGGIVSLNPTERVRQERRRRHQREAQALDVTPVTNAVDWARLDEPTRDHKITIWNRMRQVQARYPMLQILALGAVFIYGDVTLPGLGSWQSTRSILFLASLVGLASVGQTLLILLGSFDLGISGYIVAGALAVTALDLKYHLPFAVSMLLVVLGAGGLGSIAGQVCSRYRIQPFIVTLAMGTIAVGVVQVLNGGTTNGSAPAWLATLAQPATGTFGISIPPVVVMWIVVAVLISIFLYRTTSGRFLLATGANPGAADYALIRTRRVWTFAFAFSAAVAALVGVLIAGFAGSVDGSIGDPYLFEGVVSVIVGGTIFGGPGDYTRTCIGALFVTVLTTVLVGHGATAATEQIVYGAIILLAVALHGRERSLRDRV